MIKKRDSNELTNLLYIYDRFKINSGNNRSEYFGLASLDENTREENHI